MNILQDLTGQRFGRLTVIERVDNRGAKTMWLCQCECGEKRAVAASRLKSGDTESCGCLRKESLQDFTGLRFGRLVVLSIAKRDKNYVSYWNCRCDCGTQKPVKSGHLRNGHTRSCGCLRDEATSARQLTHGKSSSINPTPEYWVWKSIKARTTNPRDASYPHYGGRGITMCERWKGSFENFIGDMGSRPSKAHSIDRIDNSLGYSPENCRWSTQKDQCRNTRRNVWIEFRGERKTLPEWAEITGIPYFTLHSRIRRSNMTIKEALETPVGGAYR